MNSQATSVIYNIQNAANVNGGPNYATMQQSAQHSPASHKVCGPRCQQGSCASNESYISLSALLRTFRDFVFPSRELANGDPRPFGWNEDKQERSEADRPTSPSATDDDFDVVSIAKSLECSTSPPVPALHETYVRSLVLEEHGLPCWEPKTWGRLVKPGGAVPGDVGIYKMHTGFEKAFNIWDDMKAICAISESMFSHSSPQTIGWGARTHRNMLQKGEAFVHGASTRKLPPSITSDVVYEFSCSPIDSRGAILVLTSGADTVEAQNIKGLEQFIKRHAPAIYQYANNIRPIGEDESLYILTGCIKSASWAMAAYNKAMDPNHCTLRLEPMRTFSGDSPSEYDWTSQGSSRARGSSWHFPPGSALEWKEKLGRAKNRMHEGLGMVHQTTRNPQSALTENLVARGEAPGQPGHLGPPFHGVLQQSGVRTSQSFPWAHQHPR
ncbi:hypothetical protein NMY22_g3227 [Coprinellus aureogranulatus]|nr:hypothetical protein NMY22_g3227 [Coprinellus aureogranulatus]